MRVAGLSHWLRPRPGFAFLASSGLPTSLTARAIVLSLVAAFRWLEASAVPGTSRRCTRHSIAVLKDSSRSLTSQKRRRDRGLMQLACLLSSTANGHSDRPCTKCFKLPISRRFTFASVPTTFPNLFDRGNSEPTGSTTVRRLLAAATSRHIDRCVGVLFCSSHHFAALLVRALSMHLTDLLATLTFD